MSGFEMWNKQDYIKYWNYKYQPNITRINEYWDKLRKGYNFIIVYKEVNELSIKFYSVEFFNKMFV